MLNISIREIYLAHLKLLTHLAYCRAAFELSTYIYRFHRVHQSCQLHQRQKKRKLLVLPKLRSVCYYQTTHTFALLQHKSNSLPIINTKTNRNTNTTTNNNVNTNTNIDTTTLSNKM